MLSEDYDHKLLYTNYIFQATLFRYINNNSY